MADLLEKKWREGDVVLDPFCGTGTTALVCAERGIPCDTTDINHFLLWLARAKTAQYSAVHIAEFRDKAGIVTKAIRRSNGEGPWTPPLHQIEKWWSGDTLAALGRAMGAIRRIEKAVPTAVSDLMKVAFCRTMIDHANVSFGHQSMSFKKQDDRALTLPLGTADHDEVALTWARVALQLADSAGSEIRAVPTPILCDARDLRQRLDLDRYGCVITSPPYPNRMSYIRELRPYMYWLGYLNDGREAGELDWKAIGGTWGCATSNVAKWTPETPLEVPFGGFEKITENISDRSGVLGRYVSKYFHDMMGHCESLFAVVAPGGTVHYIVGNSKFYDVMLPVERIFAAMFEAVGFHGVTVETIRKRTSKKELFEFVVSAQKPG
ncbi:MAG: site-specific DNA-methyltransferase [Polyangiaceae bacterium]|nr:site-specific DNA-methyltransferase [Polyangiaceae bacterium]